MSARPAETPDPSKALPDPREERFAQELFKDPKANQGKAALIAGYGPKGARQIASRLLKEKPYILERVRLMGEAAASCAVLTRADLLNRLALTIKGTEDYARFVHPDETPIPIHELPRDCRAAIKSRKVSSKATGRGKPKTILVEEFEVFDSRPHIEAYAKLAGYAKDTVELTGKDGGPIQTSTDWNTMPSAQKREVAREIAFLLSEAARGAGG